MKIKTDLHVHTHLSSCAKKSALAEDYLPAAVKNGITTIGFADHTWDENLPCPYEWYIPQNMERLLKVYEKYKSLSDESVKILVGCETEYDLARRDIAITPEAASKLDFVLVPVSHTHITMPKGLYDDKAKHAAYMLDAWFDVMKSDAAEYVTAIAHPFFAVCCPYDNREVMKLITNSQYEDCFNTAKEKNIAVEINSASFCQRSLGEIVNDAEAIRMYTIAKECGCKFTFGSDAHDIPETDTLICAYTLAAVLGLTQDDLLDI